MIEDLRERFLARSYDAVYPPGCSPGLVRALALAEQSGLRRVKVRNVQKGYVFHSGGRDWHKSKTLAAAARLVGGMEWPGSPLVRDAELYAHNCLPTN